ncbi:TetR/AcrR family transcriptional regulator [Paenibacillus kribbensis]|uniref:TetR family transcriptional regulator n=1 Tax=Paenibacillus kribbensis TaxID=172713 RepID=A0A222WNN2_9BACL|nr:TetR/AcrR family transcriptional regulator [Paenibacillus kribbensis]ASR47413.1 TetR family transcriptional regulator [Paenibacillus kribbensis]
MSRPREFDVDRALHQSMEVFWTKGFKSTSFEDLTQTTRVKKQSLYGVFDDKRSLFLKALVLYRKQSVAVLEELVSQDDMSPIKKLDAIRGIALGQCHETIRRGCLMVNSALEFGTDDKEVKREVEMMFAEVEQLLEKIIRSGQEQQLITTRYTSKELAAYLNNALQGAKMMEKSGASWERIDMVLYTSFAMIVP